MKQPIKYLLLLLFSIYSSCSYSETIQLNFDLALPSLLTEKTDFTVDFGVSGSNIEFLDLTVDVIFSDNLWSSGETFMFSWLEDPELGYLRTAQLVRNDTSSLSLFLSTTSIGNLFINDDGLAFFKIGVFGGDGAYFESVTLTANANIQAVPLPGGLILFLSGLAFITRKSYHRHKRT